MDRQQRMEMETSARAARLIEAITQDGDTFPIEAARELIGLVPLTRDRGFPVQIEANAKMPGSTAEAATAGGGSASFQDEDGGVRWSLGQPTTWRCGWYKLNHRAGRLEIKQLFQETYEDETGRACLLRYERRTGDPVRLDVLVQLGIQIGRLALRLNRYRPWKVPEPAQSHVSGIP